MNRERMRLEQQTSAPPIGSGGSNLGHKPTPEEIAEAKAQQERGLDLSIRQHALQQAIQLVATGMPVIGDATVVELAQDFYSFLKGNN